MEIQIKKKTLSVVLISLLVISMGLVIFNAYNKKAMKTGKVSAIASKENIPPYISNNPKIMEAYMAAMDMGDAFKYLPCYCGCGTHSMVHRGEVIPKMYNLRECFIRADGIWESHAALDCPACVQTALDAKQWLSEGKSLREVRELIDQKYSRLGGMPTQTPLPPEGV